ncbi:MAG: response regulator [Phycisphaerales bacterium]|nr:response regulator [Phycisphaerales bacterium]
MSPASAPPPDAAADLRRHVEALADQMCRAVDGDFDFAVTRASEDATVQKLQMLVNFVLSAAHRTMHDLTRQNNMLARAKNAADAASRAKSAFLATMSHELRSPLTAIIGFAEMLDDAESPESTKQWREGLQVIQQNGMHLLGVINDILDISKIEAGKMTIDPVPCSPFEIVDDVTSLMRVRAETKGLALEMQFAGPVPVTIVTDPARLRQILINLLGNAIKFTEHGHVCLVAQAITSAGDPFVQFDVLDTGIGMTGEQTGNLFRDFTQADSSMSRRFGGTGLGLVVSRRLAELLGGGVSIIQSRPGVGSQFRATVATGPLDGVSLVNLADARVRAKDVPVHRRPEFRLPPCRILLAEDGPDNQRLISLILTRAGAEVTLVENGKQAVDAATNARKDGHPFAVVLMDMQMPVMDGYQAARCLRDDGYDGPIIALTAHAMKSDRQACLDAGCDDYAAKPIDRATLFQVIHAQLNRFRPGEWPRRPLPVPAVESSR